jgi:Tol biopolymer transport system component
MTGPRDLDRDLSLYLQGRSASRAPASLLDDALARVETTRQRPGWFNLARWLPARVTAPRTSTPNAAVVLAAVALLVALATALAVVGSRHRVPPPFGPARPGVLAFDVAGDIFVANLDGTGRAQLTSGPGMDTNATFSPDGTLIAYESGQPDLSTALVVIRAYGGQPVTVLDQLVGAGGISWSPDGRRLAVSARPPGALDPGIFLATIDPPGAVRLGGPELFGYDPSWSPDGRSIAFTRATPCCPGASEALWLIGEDGSNPHAIAPMGGGWGAAWSPDGKRIAFMAEGVDGPNDVYVINADLSGVRNISHSPEDESGVSWSPDGGRIAFTGMSTPYGNRSTLVVADPDGANRVELAGPYLSWRAPVWSPDGTQLLGFAFRDPLEVGANMDSDTFVVAFDPSGKASATTMPIERLGGASWQRRAP